MGTTFTRAMLGVASLGISETLPSDTRNSIIQATGAPGTGPGGGGNKGDDNIQEAAELARRRRVAQSAANRGRRSTILGGLGGPQPAASRITLLGGA